MGSDGPVPKASASLSSKRPISVLVMAIGEAHQLLHVLGPARELAKDGVEIGILISTHWHEKLIAAHAPELSPFIIRSPIFYSHQPLYRCPARLPNLLASAAIVKRFEAVLTPERTSTALKKIFGSKGPALIHIPHGAGDRAKGYEQRIRLFDMVLTAGQKDHDAFIRMELTTPERCHVIGYCKFDVLPASAPRFFDNECPVVLYNPHFDETLSSWRSFEPDLVKAFAETPEFNFIIAPHIRLHGKGRRLFDELAERYPAPNLRFDGGSIHSVNMDYTRCADIYLGDASSQVYEFLRVPKPCVFLNAHAADWRGNPHYRHWTFGRVAASAREALGLILMARQDHSHYVKVQEAGISDAISSGAPSPSTKAAIMIQQFLLNRRASAN